MGSGCRGACLKSATAGMSWLADATAPTTPPPQHTGRAAGAPTPHSLCHAPFPCNPKLSPPPTSHAPARFSMGPLPVAACWDTKPRKATMARRPLRISRHLKSSIDSLLLLLQAQRRGRAGEGGGRGTGMSSSPCLRMPSAQAEAHGGPGKEGMRSGHPAATPLVVRQLPPAQAGGAADRHMQPLTPGPGG